jgi:malonyl-CoA O-methyltransferase
VSSSKFSWQATLDAYDRWAPQYPPEPHNPLMEGEQRVMLTLWPDVENRRVLDLASGSGRYGRIAAQRGAREVIALDLSPMMLGQIGTHARIQGEMQRLPFTDATFDVVIAGLAIGHLDDLLGGVEEIARVLTAGGVLLYSDFHPAAAAVGLKRTFTDRRGALCEVPHHLHDIPMQREALARAGLSIEQLQELRAGKEFCEIFQGSTSFYERWLGLPLLVIVRARK